MHPSAHAARDPAKPAVIMAASGDTIDYAALEARPNQSSHLLRELGLQRGASVASLFENGAEVSLFGLGVQRSGLYQTSISNKLSVADIGCMWRDRGASVLVTSDRYADIAKEAAVLADGVPVFRWSDWSARSDSLRTNPIEDESPDTDMLYSSGTTGRPKGVRFPLPIGTFDQETPLMKMGTGLYGMGPETIYLSTSPLYHAAPLQWGHDGSSSWRNGSGHGQLDAEAALALIERYAVSHATLVPTHFIRMLKLPGEARSKYASGSLRAVVHTASPCLVPVKQAMLDWWSPIIHEYYSGTEQSSFCP